MLSQLRQASTKVFFLLVALIKAIKNVLLEPAYTAVQHQTQQYSAHKNNNCSILCKRERSSLLFGGPTARAPTSTVTISTATAAKASYK